MMNGISIHSSLFIPTLIAVIPILNFIGKCRTGTEVRSGKNSELSAEINGRTEDCKMVQFKLCHLWSQAGPTPLRRKEASQHW